MSMIRCNRCERLLDSDFITFETVEHKYGDFELCPACADKRQDELDRGDAMAAAAEAAGVAS